MILDMQEHHQDAHNNFQKNYFFLIFHDFQVYQCSSARHPHPLWRPIFQKSQRSKSFVTFLLFELRLSNFVGLQIQFISISRTNFRAVAPITLELDNFEITFPSFFSQKTNVFNYKGIVECFEIRNFFLRCDSCAARAVTLKVLELCTQNFFCKPGHINSNSVQNLSKIEDGK